MSTENQTAIDHAGTIAVFEKKPRWTPELQRQFLNTPIYVRGLVSLSEKFLVPEKTSQQSPPLPKIVIIALEKVESSCLQFLGRLTTMNCPPTVIVIGYSQAMEMEWTLREFGVTHFIAEKTTGEQLAIICQRLLTE